MNLKSKLRKQEEQRQNHRHGEGFDGYQMGGGFGGMAEEVRGLRSTNRKLQNSHGEVNYNIGQRVAKKLICMTYGHEQWCGFPEGVGHARWRG